MSYMVLSNCPYCTVSINTGGQQKFTSSGQPKGHFFLAHHQKAQTPVNSARSDRKSKHSCFGVSFNYENVSITVLHVTVHVEPSVKSHIANSGYRSKSNNNPIHTSNNSKVQWIITPLLDIV